MDKVFEKIIDRLEKSKHEICLTDDDLEYYKSGLDEAIEIVKQEAAGYKHENDWIPCEKQFPEDEKAVQVTYISYYDNKTPMCDAMAYRKDGEWKWVEDDSEVRVKITAWKELCEPYQEQKTKTEEKDNSADHSYPEEEIER